MAEAKIEIVLSNGARAGETLKELTKTANRLNREIKDLKPGTAEFVNKSKDFQTVSARIGDLNSEIKGTARASDALKNAFSQFVPFSGTFQGLGKSFGVAKSGVGGLISSMGALRAAIIATGVGALIVALSSLVLWLSKTDAGAVFLEGTMNGLGNSATVLSGRFINLKESAFQFFTNPIRFFSDLAKDMAEGVKEGYLLAKVFDELDDKRREIELANAESEKTVSQLMLQSKNVAASYEERLSLLDKASAIEQADFERRQKHSNETLAAIQREVDFAEKHGQAKDEQYDKLNEARIQVIKMEQESINLQEKIENRRSQLLDKQQAERDKAHQVELKRQEEIRKAEEERLKATAEANANIEDLKIQLISDAQEREIEQIRLNTTRKIEAIIESGILVAEQVTLQQDLEQQQIQAVKDKHAADAAAKDEKAKAEQLARDKKLHDEQKRIAEERAEFERNLEQIQQDTALETFQFGADMLSKTVKNEQAARNIRKIGAIAEIAMNLQRELSANAVAAATAGANAGLAAPAVIAGYTAKLNIASIIRAAIATAKVLLFKKGGVLKGPSHQGGGIPLMSNGGQIYGEAEGDEIVLTKGVYRNPVLRRAASRLNVMGGGRAFATGGPINPLQSASTSSSTVRSVENESTLRMERLENAFLSYAEKVDKWPRTLKVANNIQETRAAINTLNQIEDEANVN